MTQRGNLHEDPVAWLTYQFEFEFCAECGGDAGHHQAIPVLGNWFAFCLYGTEDGTRHPVIEKYRAEYEVTS